MKRVSSITICCVLSVILFTKCELMLVLLDVNTDNCERYSTYRTTLFDADDLLWEETVCDSDSYGIKERFEEKLSYYEEQYSASCVYSEHVSYSQ